MRSYPLFNLYFFLLLAVTSWAQPKSAYSGLNHFLNTDFIQKYEEARTRAERSVQDFQRIQSEFSAQDVESVMTAYNASAERFNEVLYKIKDDLLNRQKRKFIIQFPDDYSQQIESELNRAKEFYSNNYQRELLRVTDGRITGTPFLALLPDIIKYGKLAFQVFQSIRAEIKKYNDSLLEEHLIQPYRFKSWNELVK